MTVSSQRTLLNVDLQLAMICGANYECLPNTTLNEKFGIEPDTYVAPGEYPRLKYIAIGTGGNPGINDSKGFIYSEHGPMDGALFNQIPFVMREMNDDITLDERSKYRFRTHELHNGRQYICYYLKVITENPYDNKFYNIKTLMNEQFISTYDTNTTDILYPTPRNRSVRYDVIEQTDFVTKLIKLKFVMEEQDLIELKKVYEILGDKNNQLTELALCTGIDKVSNGLTEARCVQVGWFMDLNLDLTYSFNNYKTVVKYIEIGGAEPLLK